MVVIMIKIQCYILGVFGGNIGQSQHFAHGFLSICMPTNNLCVIETRFNCWTNPQTLQSDCVVMMIRTKHVSSLWRQYWQQKPGPNCAWACFMPQSYCHLLAATLYLRYSHPRFEEIGVDFGWVPRCVTMYFVVAMPGPCYCPVLTRSTSDTSKFSYIVLCYVSLPPRYSPTVAALSNTVPLCAVLFHETTA